MDMYSEIQSQYNATFKMLKQVILKCPANRWDDSEDRKKFWRVAYHAIFYTHLYLQDSLDAFKPWYKHRDQYELLGVVPHPPHEPAKIVQPYSLEDILEYMEFCQEQVAQKIPALDLEKESGFSWLPFNKLGVQIYNIRHLQHHTAELIEWLGAKEGIEVDWSI